MHAHKFKVGDYVRVAPRTVGAVPAGRYQVVRQMPPEGAQNQYRVRYVDDGHERMVKESDLT
ncbi:MAG: hypothetical protein AB7O88_25810 [Reyranellaceae bacterium]